jgi:tetratricopeptide (TPR) repeat protein
MIGKTVAHYKIIEKLGEGGMGEVYLAHDTELARKVALKFLPKRVASDPDALARFKREAQAAAALNHPNIITIHEIGRYEEQSYIAMAYIDGELLSDELAKGVPLERALDIAGQVCQGLDKAHRAGIIHRDIKPENLLIDPDGRVKILDFGLATVGKPKAEATDDSTAGTVYYMSPEQVQGSDVDARSDVFSLGAVLYEMLAGKKPFDGAHTEAVRYSIVNEDPAPLSGLNPRVAPELERVVMKALAKNPADRYTSVSLLASDLESMTTTATAPRHKPGGFSRRLAIPGIVILLAVVALFVVNPFKVRIAPERDAVAGGNTVAIMYFENMVQQGDPERLGEIISNLLITNLSQSQDLKVVSSQRLYDILKQKGREGAKVIDRTTASDIAEEAGARYMMLGSILQVEPNLVVTMQLVDVATGNVESSERVTGTSGETVFDLVDRMTGDARNELGDPVQLDVARPRPVAEVTTNSIDAYRHYLEGVDNARKMYETEACESFRRALQYDSTFAMAYLELSWSVFNMGKFREGFDALENAKKYVDRVSGKEKLYIQAAISGVVEGNTDDANAFYKQIIAQYPDEKRAYYYLGVSYYLHGDYPNARDYFRKVIELDPAHKESYNQLAYVYDHLGDFDKSIWAINQYIELAPDEPNPYDSRGDLYAYNGDIANAIASYKKTLEIKPNFLRTPGKLGYMYMFNGQYDMAEETFRSLLESPESHTRAEARYLLTKIPMYQGRLRAALSALDEAMADDEADGHSVEYYMYKLGLRIYVLIELGEYDRAYEDASEFRGRVRRYFPVMTAPFDFYYAELCSQMNRLGETEDVLTRYEAALDTLDQASLQPYHLAKGYAALCRDDSEAAIRHFESADRLDPNDYTIRYVLARAYLMGGRVDDAIRTLEAALERYDEDRMFDPIKGVRGYYLLGTAYQRAGRNDEAIEQFETFLEIWKDADPELEEVPDAKRRLEKLRRSS